VAWLAGGGVGSGEGKSIKHNPFPDKEVLEKKKTGIKFSEGHVRNNRGFEDSLSDKQSGKEKQKSQPAKPLRKKAVTVSRVCGRPTREAKI